MSAKVATLDARRMKRVMTLLSLISTRAANDAMPTADQWARIVRDAADIQREIESEEWYVAEGRRPKKRGRKPIGEAARNHIARLVADDMKASGIAFGRACKAVAACLKAAGMEGGDARTVETCCHRAARSSYPEYRALFGLTAP